MALRASRLLLMAAAKPQRARASAEKLSTKVPKAEANPNPNPDKRGKTGITAPYPVSPEMGRFFGVSEISRAQAVKKIWEYIKEKNLQNPTNKKEIICDDKLKTLFDGRTTVGFLEISKLMAPHFIKIK